MDIHGYTVTLHGEPVAVGAGQEFDLLCLLMMHPGWVVGYQQIYNAFDHLVSNDHIHHLIYRLRKKIGMDRVVNVRGRGWKVVDPDVPRL